MSFDELFDGCLGKLVFYTIGCKERKSISKVLVLTHGLVLRSLWFSTLQKAAL